MDIKLRLQVWRMLGILFFLGIPLHALADVGRLADIQVSNSSTASHLEFTLTQSNPTSVFTLSNPERLVIDFKDTRLAYKLKNLTVTGVNNIRAGRPQPSTLRLVFDLNSAAKVQHFYQAKNNRLLVDLYFATSAPKKMADTKPAVEVETKPIVQKTPVLQAPTQRTRPIIVVIDPGHGGKDTGAIGENGTREKDVVLAISKNLADLINQQPGMRAVLTRNGDYFVPLRNRLKLARKGNADLFIAIHADSYFNSRASGASVYALSRRGATSEAARWLAKRDNTSELGGVDLGELEDQSYLLRSVLIDLAQTATVTDSLRLGVSILDSLDALTRLHYTRVEQAPFVVLKSPDIPSVLVETGFISNASEEARLRDKNFQNKIAQALLNGIRSYIKKYPPGV
jgi:N-acetylmuramoyl-L-alanine amidase